tara:strand:+ start:402 stop:1070 length:669 start_codon:yes stop_codon:yes gene_type:complete
LILLNLSKKKPTAIFDLDGTLVDSLHGIALAMKKTLAEFNYEVSVDNILPRIGAPMIEVVEELTQEKPEEIKKIYKEYLALYRRAYLRQIIPLSGADKLINNLYDSHFSLAIVTNKTEQDARSVIEALSWSTKFKIIVGRDTKKLPKPHPEGTIYALNKCNANPNESVFIGDTEYDMAAGKNAGVKFLIGLLGSRDATLLEAAGANQIANNLCDVEKMLLPN